jgi:hypothetical protein
VNATTLERLDLEIASRQRIHAGIRECGGTISREEAECLLWLQEQRSALAADENVAAPTAEA